MVATKAVTSKAAVQAAVKAGAKAGSRAGSRAAGLVASLQKAVNISPVLRKFLGPGDMTRPDITKKIWAYVKENKLQNPENGREIVCDDKLKTVFGQERVGFGELQKLISTHIPKAEN